MGNTASRVITATVTLGTSEVVRAIDEDVGKDMCVIGKTSYVIAIIS